MSVSRYIEKVKTANIDKELVNKISEEYDAKLPELVEKLISVSGKGEFVNAYRFLSFSEILYAEEDWGISLKEKKIIPIVDCNDNDFIVYNASEKEWQMYNIVDEISFQSAEELMDLIQ